jgi:hypothetical protein
MESRQERGTKLFSEFVVLIAVAVYFGLRGDLSHDGQSFGTKHFELPPNLVAPSAVEQLQADLTFGSPVPRGQNLKDRNPRHPNEMINLLMEDEQGFRKVYGESHTNIDRRAEQGNRDSMARSSPFPPAGEEIKGMPFPNPLTSGPGKNLWPK